MPIDPITAADALGQGAMTPAAGLAAPEPAPATDFAVAGPEWQIGGVAPATPAENGFGGMLAQKVGELSGLQGEAAQASRALADGTATDVSATVMSVERAKLAMQLASQIRTKGVEAAMDVFHTQV